jgi:hypothetical protein
MRDILQRIKIIHKDCHQLIKQSLDNYRPVAGNIGIFCQSDNEYEDFSEIKEKFTFRSDNPKQKYFQLKEPIVIPNENNIPKAKYTHLYIRKPDLSPFGRYLGDIDFVMQPEKYNKLKKKVRERRVKGADLYTRPGWDMVKVTDPKISSIAFITTNNFAEKIRIKFD